MVTRCNICHGFTHHDRACHYCGAITIMGITWNALTRLPMGRAFNSRYALPSNRVGLNDAKRTATEFARKALAR